VLVPNEAPTQQVLGSQPFNACDDLLQAFRRNRPVMKALADAGFHMVWVSDVKHFHHFDVIDDIRAMARDVSEQCVDGRLCLWRRCVGHWRYVCGGGGAWRGRSAPARIRAIGSCRRSAIAIHLTTKSCDRCTDGCGC